MGITVLTVEEMYMDILNRANDYVWHIFRQNEQHKISVTLNRYTFQGE